MIADPTARIVIVWPRPQRAPDQSRMADASLAAHDRRDGDDVVRIGRVAHAEKKSERDDGEQSDHIILRPRPQRGNVCAGVREISDIRASPRRFWRIV